MHPQLAHLLEEFDDASARLRGIVARVESDAWSRRPDPARWSVGECIEHLNLTARAYLPLLDQAIADARRIGGGAPSRYRRDLFGWLLWKTMGPPVRFRTKTIAAFVPGSDRPRDACVADFERLQEGQKARVRQCDGLPLQKVRVVSPFDARIHYNAYSCLTLLPPHQQRHLWQAEQVIEALERP